MEAAIAQAEDKYLPETQLEKELNLKEQYDQQINILKETGLLKTNEQGQPGIQGYDNQFHPVPEYSEVRQAVREQKELLQNKAEQGFIKLLLVPFAANLNSLKTTLAQTLLKHKDNLKDNQGNKVELNENNPVYMWEGWSEEQLAYFPQRLEQNHGGITKEQAIQDKGAFHILFMEDLKDIPRQGEGQEKGNRKQLEAGQTARDYLQTFHNNQPPYDNEEPFTPEAHSWLQITNLEEKQTITDDYDRGSGGTGSTCYLPGAYHAADGVAPYAYWYRGGARVDLDGCNPVVTIGIVGVRAAVRVVKKP
jgi:hypothetical protein